MPEQLGARLACYRSALGWTQQELAERIGVSRVAVSHFEMGLQVPSERTIALLAGVFKMEPSELVAGTYYPPAKTERLPQIVAQYTSVEHEIGLLERDLGWIERLPSHPQNRTLARAALHGWLDRLGHLLDTTTDKRTIQQVRDAQRIVQQALTDREPRTKN